MNRTVRTIALAWLVAALLALAPAARPGVLAGAKPEPPKNERVTFNFVDIDLPVITRFVSEMTKKNFLFDERVKGKITIIAPSKIPVADAFQLFTAVLELKGYTVVPAGENTYKILPAVEARQQGLRVATDRAPVNDSYIVRLISLKDIAVETALRFIQPLVSRDGHASAFSPGNILLVVDANANIDKILSIVEMIDQPALSEAPEICSLKFAGAEAVAKILNEGLGRATTAIRAPGQAAAAIETARAIADTRLNAVILFGDKAKRAEMRSLIALLDVPSPEARGMINIYFCENADATELAKVLEGLVKTAQTAQKPPATVAAAPVFETAGGISVSADKASNALVVVASPADYASLSQVIRQLDRRKRQVFVEAMIAEVSIDKLLDLGTKWRAAVISGGEPVFVTGVGQVDTTTISGIISGLTGLSLGGLGNYFTIPKSFIPGATSDVRAPGIAALFSFSELKTAVNVLSTPQLLTSDNKEAEIVVGKNVPFISKRERDLTTTNTVINAIERKDVGITLRITPQINEGDFVKLNIFQEISNLMKESESIITSVGPTTTVRSTKTSVVVQDRQTVVISGLMQEQDEETLTKVPYLSDIPLLGWLFKFRSTNKVKTNLLVFLTPYIIKEGATIEALTQSKADEFARAENRYKRDEILVEFREHVSPEQARALLAGQDAAVLSTPAARTYRVRIPQEADLEKAIRAFQALPEVRQAGPVDRLPVSRTLPPP